MARISAKYSDDLFQLIKSLTKAEKRYFKLLSNTQGGEKNYLRLFDAIDRQISYDEEAIRKQFEGERFVRQLHVAKSYLQEQILRALRSHHDEGSPKASARAMLRNVEVLYEKGLFKQARKVLRKAVEFIQEHELHVQMQEAIDLQGMMLSLPKMELLEALKEQMRRRHESLRKFERLIEYDHILQMIDTTLASGHPRNAAASAMLDELYAHPMMLEPYESLSPREKSLVDWIHLVYHYGKRDYRRAYTHLLNLLEKYERNPKLILERPSDYLMLMSDVLVLRQHLGDHAGFQEAYDRLREQAPQLAAYQGLQRGRVQPMLFTALYHRRAMFLTARGEFRECVELVDTWSRDTTLWGDHSMQVPLAMFQHLVAYAHFALGEYMPALMLANTIINGPEPHRYANVYSSARLFTMIIHYELGNIEYLGSLTRSMYRFLKSRNTMHKFEQIILGFFQRLLRLRTSSELRNELIVLRERLEPLATDVFERGPFTYFDYISWLDSRIEGISFAEAVRRRKSETTPAT